MSDRELNTGAVADREYDTEKLDLGAEEEEEEEEEEKCTCVTAEKREKTPSLQELEEVLHSAPRSCRHGDEVWPRLYLGDM